MGRVNVFFQPLERHLHLAHRLVEGRLQGFCLRRLRPPSAGQPCWQPCSGPLLPLADLPRRHPIVRGSCMDRPFPSPRFQDDLRCDFAAMRSPSYRHRCWLSSPLAHLTEGVVQILGSIILGISGNSET